MRLLMIGALLSFAGAVLALWLVREREIERELVESREPQRQPETGRLPEAATS
jgi:hypothetical protein